MPSAVSTARVATHLRTLGILWVAFSAYLVLRWLLVLPVLHAMFGRAVWMGGSHQWVDVPFHPGGWLLHLITVMVFARALLSLITGLALLRPQPWGRIFAIVIAVLTLFKPIVGTVLAIYTLWVLLGRGAAEQYDAAAATTAQADHSIR